MLITRSTKSQLKHSLFCGLLLCRFVPYLVNGEILEFTENRSVQIFPVSAGSKRFSLDLDYPQAFELKITAFNGNESETGFCDPYPAKIISKVEWNGPINTTSDEPDETGESENHSYDNIEFFNNTYFILESLSFNITAIRDFTDRKSYIRIESEFQNEDEEQQLEDTYFILDPDDHYLFIITRRHLFSYSLDEFFKAVEKNKAIPKIKYEAPNFKGYEMISSIRYHKHRLYVVADNIVEVFVINNKGEVTPQIKFDAAFFDKTEVSITDIVFRGNYAYVLDKLKGIYVVDVSHEDLPDHTNVTDKYKFQPEDTTEVQKGQFIEVIGDSLHVISSGTKTPYLFEFINRGDPLFEKLEFNRKAELFQSVRDTFTDSNYLYLITGFFNMATKHSIPGRYHTLAVNDYLTEYWPLLGAKALISRTINQTSQVAVLHEDYVTVLVFTEANPFISCNTQGIPEGIYSYKLQAIQKDCPEEAKSNDTDYNTVCIINQEVRLMVIEDTAYVTTIEETQKTVTYLYIGIAVMTVLVILFIYLFRKYKNQYQRLEHRIKFQKLENDNTDQGTGNRKQVDSQEIDPYSINIQAELKKDEERSKKKSPTKSPNKSPNKYGGEPKPNVEFGDIKPLDVEEIYGRKNKASQDDDEYSL